MFELNDADALCTIEDVVDRVESIEGELSDKMARLIASGILTASDMARHEGNIGWDAFNAPRAASRIVAAATARWVNNSEGLVTSRAADETLAWAEMRDPGAITFTEQELGILHGLVENVGKFGTGGFTAGTIFRDRDTDYVEYVPVYGLPNAYFPWTTVNTGRR